MKQNKSKIVDVGNYCSYEYKISSIMKMKDEFKILTDDGEIKLEVDIIADFEQVPEEYREIFVNMMTTRYKNMVSFTNNIFSKNVITKPQNWFIKLYLTWKKLLFNYT